MFKLKLATRFTLILLLSLLGGILVSSLVLSTVLGHRAEAEVSYHSQVLMQMVNSVRSYTDKRISPLLAEQIDTGTTFLPEAIPSFAAREVFESVRKAPEFQNYFYKDATLNPTNLRDLADKFETEITTRFQTHPEQQAQLGFRTIGGEKLFYSARPLRITQSSCLRCHSTPEVAPRSHIATYGSENGFGWQLHQVIGSQIMYVPAQNILETAHANFATFMLIFILIFTAIVLLINVLLKRTVIAPIKPMAQLAQKIGDNSMDASSDPEVEIQKLGAIAKRSDELGQLGRIFQRMAREVQMREQALKQQLQALRVEINQTKRAKEVSEIAQTEYFQKLQREAKKIREQWRSQSDTQEPESFGCSE